MNQNQKNSKGLELKNKNKSKSNPNQDKYQKKIKCPNQECQKEVNPDQVYCLEDLGIDFCVYCQETVE